MNGKRKFRRIFTRFAMGGGFGIAARVRFAFGHMFHNFECDCVECE